MLKIRMLKYFEASLDEESLAGLGPQVKRLLVYLALRGNAWVDKEEIRRDLKTVRWSEDDCSVLSPNKVGLNQLLRRLRVALGAEAHRLQTGNGTVLLDLEGTEVDTVQFTRWATDGSREGLERAIRIYRGKLLSDEIGKANYWEEEWEAWVAPVRGKLHRQYLHALERLNAGDSATVIREPEPVLEFPGGGVPLDSPFYIERTQDAELAAYLKRPGQTLLIKGARQVGKTSLLMRALHQARKEGARVLYSDWQNLAQTDIDSPEAFFYALADEFAYQLQLNASPEETFQSRLAPSTNFDRFVRRHVLAAEETPLVWGIDEADRLFSCAFRDDIFGKMRAWHNERSQLDNLMRRLTIVIVYSTEAHLFIRDPNVSPFNVGVKITLQELTEAQTGELNRRYRNPIGDHEGLRQLQALTGGHPYLVRRCLHAMRQEGLTIAQVEAQAQEGGGIFAEHLARIRVALAMDSELKTCVQQFLRTQAPPTEPEFVRLCAAGLMTGDSPTAMRPRCHLYEVFLNRYLQ